MPDYEDAFEDEVLEVDPESAQQPIAKEGRYNNSENGAYIQSIQRRTIPTKRGDVEYVDIAIVLPQTDSGLVFAHTQPFGKSHTQTAKGSGSSWPTFARQLGIAGKRASEAENMAVTVDIGVDSYVRKEDQLSEEQLAAGEEPHRTVKNTIRNIFAE